MGISSISRKGAKGGRKGRQEEQADLQRQVAPFIDKYATADSLQEQVVAFVDKYAPASGAGRRRFVNDFRFVMASYALSAIAHGGLPDSDNP